MKKVGKIILLSALALVGLVLLLALAHPLWIGPAVRGVANGKVPAITGTPFTLGEFSLNAYAGRFHTGGLLLGNPAGFAQAKALELGSLDVDLDTGSLFSDVIVIREIALRDIFVSYMSRDRRSNFDIIAENAQKAAGDGEAEETTTEEPSEKKDGEGKKVIIDRLVISGLKVQWEMLTLPVPTIELTGIGRESNGADWVEVAQKIADAVMKHLGALGEGVKELGGVLKGLGEETAKQALDAVKQIDATGAKQALDAVKQIDATGAKQALSAGAGAAASAAESAAEAAGTLAAGAGKAAGSAVDAVGAGATKAAEATGDALKGAGKALKGLLGN